MNTWTAEETGCLWLIVNNIIYYNHRLLEKGYAFYGYFIIVAIMLKNNTESSKKSIICLGTIWQQVRWRRDVTDEFAGAAGTFYNPSPLVCVCVCEWTLNSEQYTEYSVQRGWVGSCACTMQCWNSAKCPNRLACCECEAIMLALLVNNSEQQSGLFA